MSCWRWKCAASNVDWRLANVPGVSSVARLATLPRDALPNILSAAGIGDREKERERNGKGPAGGAGKAAAEAAKRALSGLGDLARPDRNEESEPRRSGDGEEEKLGPFRLRERRREREQGDWSSGRFAVAAPVGPEAHGGDKSLQFRLEHG